MKKMMKEKDMDKVKAMKLEVLEELRQAAMDMMADKVKGGMDEMKKVTVASPTKEGLKAGLEKAEDVLESEMPEMEDEEEMDSEEESEEEDSEEKMDKNKKLAKLFGM